jgi:Protein of unknown function (DUF3716)
VGTTVSCECCESVSECLLIVAECLKCEKRDGRFVECVRLQRIHHGCELSLPFMTVRNLTILACANCVFQSYTNGCACAQAGT